MLLCVCAHIHLQGHNHDVREGLPGPKAMAWGTGARAMLADGKQFLTYSVPCWLACTQSQICVCVCVQVSAVTHKMCSPCSIHPIT